MIIQSVFLWYSICMFGGVTAKKIFNIVFKIGFLGGVVYILVSLGEALFQYSG